LHATEPKVLQRFEPHLRRVLIVDPTPVAARMLAGLLRGLGARELLLEADEASGLELAKTVNPDLIFVEHSGPRLDGERFARRLRRSDFACRRVPVIMVTADATLNTIMGARDSGVHEFLRKPFTAADLIRRVELVISKPRDWIEAVQYVGPDRRRFNSGEYSGRRKRRSDKAQTPSEENALALDRSARILRSAVSQFDTDPAQARRAIAAQALFLKTALNTAAVASEVSPRLAVAVAMLELTLERGDAAQKTIAGLVKDVLELVPDHRSGERAA
jgi:two-component system, response regulator PdtaR